MKESWHSDEGNSGDLTHNLNERASKPTDGTSLGNLRFCGANLRSMFAPGNFYSLNHFLKTEKPDIMLVSETWHVEESRTSLPHKQYSILFSPHDGVKAEGVAIIYRRPLIVAPLFKEFHNKNLILARISSASSKPMILLSVYIPPNQPRRKEAIAHLVRTIEFLHQRYASFGLLGFGDLNADLMSPTASPKAQHISQALAQCGIRIEVYHRGEKYTRVREVTNPI